MFGCVPGARKGQWHVRTHTAGREYFARMLLDLYYFVGPQLNIVDGIIAMEGQGPGFGDPRPLGLVIAGADGVAVDRVIAEILNVTVEQVPTLMVALQEGYGTARLEEIAVRGESIAEVSVAGFKMPQFQDMMAKIPRSMLRLIKAYLTTQPVVKKERCVECEMCLCACPRQCITHPAGALRINEAACIQCLCCMEICPQGAIELRPGAMLKLFSGIRKIMGKS
jgi:Pyruvate/2-oxoacid:ferredoxin oxidoreductase delta subunit